MTDDFYDELDYDCISPSEAEIADFEEEINGPTDISAHPFGSVISDRDRQFKGTAGTGPFINYKIYGPRFDDSDGRWRIAIVHTDKTVKRLGMTYAKFIMCLYLNRIITREEQVDHKDGDRLNDVLSNLQLLSNSENNIKRLIEHDITHKIVTLRCPNPKCRIIFEKRISNTSIYKKSAKTTSCTRKCAAIFGHLVLQNGNTEEILKMISENFVSIRNDKYLPK